MQIFIRRRLIKKQKALYRDIWPIDKGAAQKPEGWSGWPEGKKIALVLIHDVDTQIGHDNCYNLMKLEQELGFRSSFNFVPERYNISQKLLNDLGKNGFDIGVHGLKHDGKLFLNKGIFQERAVGINNYLKAWDTRGFSSPSMHRNFEWMYALDIDYATSSFDTDPFEPQPDGVGTIFPFIVNNNNHSYVELPYTLPQDHTLFILMKETNINIWKKKLNWIAEKGGMALLMVHPDYIDFSSKKSTTEQYPAEYYRQFLEYIINDYKEKYWQALPRDISSFWKNKEVKNST